MASEFPAAVGILQRAIARRAFPAAVIEVGSSEGVRWTESFGRLSYMEDAPVATTETVFDLASLTKVLATAPLALRAIEERRLSLDTPVAALFQAWRGPDRERVTVADLLEHASGLTAYLPFFRDHDGQPDFERAICTLPLEHAPRTQSIYSDLGFILLAFALERLYGRAFGALFDELPGAGAVHQITFNPARAWRPLTAPTELDLWRGRLLQGEVHDENAWSLGGAAGHAGLFGTAAAVGAYGRLWLNGLRGRSSFAPAAAFARFVQKSEVPGSSRALAWDTMLPTSSCGTRLSRRAFGHTGFTGTSLWVDPERDLYVALLTNRVHPTRENNQIQAVRRAVHDAVA